MVARNHVDLIILDIRMPGIGGIDLLPKMLRRTNPNIKVIILTGQPQHRERRAVDEVRSCQLLRETAQPEAAPQ